LDSAPDFAALKAGLAKPMPQWEYRKINLNDVPRRSDDIDLLLDAGHDGWELVVVTANNVAYLKRQIEEQPVVRSTRRKTATSTSSSAQ
jgi:hypothetical protein